MPVPTSYVVVFLCSVSWGERLLFLLVILVEFLTINRIGGVMISVLASSAVDRGFGSNQRLWNWYLLFLRKARIISFTWNQDYVPEWGVMSIRGLLFQWASTITFIIIISLKINLFSLWYSWKIAELALNNTHSLDHHCLTFFSWHKYAHSFKQA